MLFWRDKDLTVCLQCLLVVKLLVESRTYWTNCGKVGKTGPLEDLEDLEDLEARDRYWETMVCCSLRYLGGVGCFVVSFSR